MLCQENTIVDTLKKVDSDTYLSEDNVIILLSQTNKYIVTKILQLVDYLRQKQVEDIVTYVINHNINFTNICEQYCCFCAFRCDLKDRDSYVLNIENIIQKVFNNVQKGATEVCIQGNLNLNLKIEKAL